MTQRRTLAATLISGALLLAVNGCDSSETIPPEGSSIVLSGNPTTVVLGTVVTADCNALLGQQADCGTSEIIATVRSELGVPLPGQDVRFSTTAGQLFTGTLSNPTSASNIPIATDSIGNAVVNLITASTTTVTGTSGNTSGSLTLNTVPGGVPLGQIVLDFDNTANSLCAGASIADVTSCTQEVCIMATALDTGGTPIDGLIVQFALQNNVFQGNTFEGTFSPAQPVTGQSGDPGFDPGVARTKFVPTSSTCNDECSSAIMAGPCDAQIVASTQGGVQSLALQLNINIP
jgi:hypothetical protein